MGVPTPVLDALLVVVVNLILVKKYFAFLPISLQRCQEDTSQCIPLIWFCDANTDCPQGSDEHKCSCEKFNLVECKTKDYHNMCVPVSWICEGFADCQDFDKTVCVPDVGNEARCDHNTFWCHWDDSCIPNTRLCDNKTDCGGAEDEVFCLGELCE